MRPADPGRYQDVVPSVAPLAGVAPATGADEPQNIELATAGSIERQQLAAGKFKQRQVIAAYDEVKRTLDEWEAELSTWEKEGPALLKSEDGKRIAADEALTRKIRAVLGEERPTVDALIAARNQAEALISPVREALSNPDDASNPSAEIMPTLRELQSQAKKNRDGYRGARTATRALIAVAPEPAAVTAGRNLEEVIAAQAQQETLERAAAVEAGVKKARDEGTRQLMEEKAKLARIETDAEAARVRNEAARKQQEINLAAEAHQAQIEQAQAKARMAQLRQRARAPDVRHYLQPFITNGRTQPASGGFRGYGQNIKVVEEGPVSFGRLRAMGALDRTISGLEHLVAAATNQNDRPTWTIPDAQFSHDWSRETQSFVQKAQDLLIELGPALVEEKMLAP